MDFARKHKTLILLLLILVIGGFFRFWRLKSVPPGLYPDVAINGMDALTTLRTGQFKVFYPENNGREGLFIWLIALSFKTFGVSVWSLKLVSAVVGFLTILGLFLLAKELFDEKIALLSSFFLAVSFWHTNFSRIGFRAILVPFLMCFGFYCLLRAKKNSGQSPYALLFFVLAGICLGLGFYTYIAFRMVVLLLGLVVLMAMWDYWQKNKPLTWSVKKIYIKDGWWRWDVFFITLIVVALPIAFHFYQVPQDFIGRASNVSVFSSPQPLKDLCWSTIKALGMFNFYGDTNWRHNYAGAPMLAWTVGILFLMGIATTLWSLRRVNDNRWKNIFILAWFAIMLLPAVLTNEGIPHALRTIGVIPVVYLFAALGFVWLAQKLFQRINPKIAVFLLAVILIHPAVDNFNKYFYRWAKNPDVTGAFRQDLVEIGNYLNGLPEEVKKYVIVNEWGVSVPYPNGLPMPAQTVMFIEQTQPHYESTIYLKPEEIDQIKLDSNYSTVIVPLKYDESIFSCLLQRYPSGQIIQIPSGYFVFKIEN